MITDLVANALNQIKLANKTGKKEVWLWSSKLLERILHVMEDEGYIRGYIVKIENNKRLSIVYLKYKDSVPTITGIKKITTPGKIVYSKYKKLPILFSGLGTVIVSTPKGVITEKKARKEKIGGVILAYIW